MRVELLWSEHVLSFFWCPSSKAALGQCSVSDHSHTQCLPISVCVQLQHYSIHERKSSTRKKRRMTAIDPKNRYKYELTYVTESNITHGLPDTETKEFEIELIHGDEFENVRVFSEAVLCYHISWSTKAPWLNLVNIQELSK